MLLLFGAAGNFFLAQTVACCTSNSCMYNFMHWSIFSPDSYIYLFSSLFSSHKFKTVQQMLDYCFKFVVFYGGQDEEMSAVVS